MPKQPSGNFSHSEILVDAEGLREDIARACSDMQKTSEKSIEVLAKARDAIAKADAVLRKGKGK
jgi:hypothetical protein